MQFAVSATRYSLRAIAEHDGIELVDPPPPQPAPLGYDEAGRKLVEQIEAFPGDDPAAAYQRDSAAALARYMQRWATFGAHVTGADLDDVAEVLGQRPADMETALAELDTFVSDAGPQEDARLIRLFHRWLKRQDFLLHECGEGYSYVGLELQPIPSR